VLLEEDTVNETASSGITQQIGKTQLVRVAVINIKREAI